MSLTGISKRVEALEKFCNGLRAGVLTIAGASEDGKLIIAQPNPGRQISPSDVAAWRGMVLFLDEAAAAMMGHQTPRQHNAEIIIRDDGDISIQKFNGWKGGPFA